MRHRRPILDILDRFGRGIGCGFLNSLTLSLILGLQKARKWARRVEGFAFGSTDFILSRTSNIPSGPSLLATSLSTSNTHFLNPFLSLRDTSRSPGLQAGKKRAEPSGPPTILWRINASTNVPRMIRIMVPASLIILPELYPLNRTTRIATNNLQSSTHTLPFSHPAPMPPTSPAAPTPALPPTPPPPPPPNPPPP